MPESSMSRLGNQYHSWVRAHPTAAQDFRDAIEDLLNDAGIIFDRVATRVKQWPSLKAKAKKRRENGELMYPNPWEDIHDVLGVRITVFHSTIIPEALEVLGETFTVLRSVDKAAETRISGGFGYGSHHLVLTVSEDSAATLEELEPYIGWTFEIQIRTELSTRGPSSNTISATNRVRILPPHRSIGSLRSPQASLSWRISNSMKSPRSRLPALRRTMTWKSRQRPSPAS